MKKSPLTLEKFKKNELPKNLYKMIIGGDGSKDDNATIPSTDPPGTVKPPGQS